jgi:transketolase
MSAVSEEAGISVKKLAVDRIPRSGPPMALVDLYGLSAKSIVNAVKHLV